MTLAGQQGMEPCAFCGEPSEREVVVLEATYRSQGGVKHVEQLAVEHWLCAHHAEAVDRDRGWKERQAKERATRSKELRQARDEATLFDPGDKKPWEDAA